MRLYLNTLKPAPGAKSPAKRLGRGIGSGTGKTAGHGHKGQHARAGGFHKLGFEGGQTPLQRRLPKFGFHSRRQRFAQEIRLDSLNKLADKVIDHQALEGAGLLRSRVKSIKLIASGKLDKAIRVKGLKVTSGARSMIEALGGSIEA